MNQSPKKQRRTSSILKPNRRISGIPSACTLSFVNSKNPGQSNLCSTGQPSHTSNVTKKITFSINENDSGNSVIVCPKVPSNNILNTIQKRKIRHSTGPNFSIDFNTNSSANSKNKAKKFASLPKQNHKMITVHIDSLWTENSELVESYDTSIELAMLALLDADNHIIPISSIATIPDCENLNDLNKLLDMTYGKGSEIFRCAYNLKTRLSFVLSIDESFIPKTLRIWNPDAKTDFSVKDVSIYEGSTMVAQGTVPQQFGMNLPLIQNDFINLNLHPKIMVYYDKFGIIPASQIKEIQIYFYETYSQENDFKMEIMKEIKREKDQRKDKEDDEFEEFDEKIQSSRNVYDKISFDNKVEIKEKDIPDTENKKEKIKYEMADYIKHNDGDLEKFEMYESPTRQIGLNGIDFINLSGELLDESDIEELTIHGIVNIINHDMIFRPNKATNDPKEMFFGEIIDGKTPYFNIKFREPQYLSKILIWNYNSRGDDLAFGVKVAKVLANGKFLWYGKIPMGVGNIHNVMHSIRQIPINQILSSKELKLKEL